MPIAIPVKQCPHCNCYLPCCCIDIASQQDAVLVAAMSEQALEDADCIMSLLDAGCSMDECAAAFSDGKVVN